MDLKSFCVYCGTERIVSETRVIDAKFGSGLVIEISDCPNSACAGPLKFKRFRFYVTCKRWRCIASKWHKLDRWFEGRAFHFGPFLLGITRRKREGT